MTKEELLKKVSKFILARTNGKSSSDMYHDGFINGMEILYVEVELILDELFNSNVVIPKGTNRHQYADVLHEWIEGTEIEGRIPNTDSWGYVPFIDNKREYRIKPSEPVYEWKWVQTEDGETYWLTGYMTKHEAKQCGCTIAVEDTKRERK